MSSPFPPQYNAEFSTTVRLRFSANGALVNEQISQTDILDLFCMATGVAAAYRVFASARVKSIEIWGPAAAAGLATVSVTWVGSGNFAGPRQNISDSTLGSARPAHVKSKAPGGSVAGMWFADTSTGGNIIVLDGPASSVVDIVIEFTVRNDEGAVAVTAAVAAATVGRVYCRKLDSTGGALLVPVALDTI